MLMIQINNYLNLGIMEFNKNHDVYNYENGNQKDEKNILFIKKYIILI